MKTKYFFAFSIAILSISLVYGQSKIMYTYKGNSSVNFDFLLTLGLTFDRPITLDFHATSGANSKGVYCTTLKNDEIINNKLSNVNKTNCLSLSVK